MKLPPSRGSPGDLDEVARGGTRINVVNRQPEGGKRGWETMVDGQTVVTRMMTNSLCVMRTRAVAYVALDVARLYSTLIRLGVKKYGIIGKDRMTCMLMLPHPSGSFYSVQCQSTTAWHCLEDFSPNRGFVFGC